MSPTVVSWMSWAGGGTPASVALTPAVASEPRDSAPSGSVVVTGAAPGSTRTKVSEPAAVPKTVPDRDTASTGIGPSVTSGSAVLLSTEPINPAAPTHNRPSA